MEKNIKSQMAHIIGVGAVNSKYPKRVTIILRIMTPKVSGITGLNFEKKEEKSE
jgi:hypothetical protein